MNISFFYIAGFVCKKAIGASVVMIGISLIAFVLSVWSPGDPAYMMLIGDGNLEPSHTEIIEMRQSLGLNNPLHTQYTNWLVRIIHGDMGRSFITGKEISHEMALRLPYTVKLALLSFLISTFLGLALGLFMVSNQNMLQDRCGQILSLALISVPDFWLAILLIGLFAETYQWLPTSGVGSFKHYILPSIVMAATSMGSLARLARTLLLEELAKDYILTARSKGIAESRVWLRHALCNSLIPLTTSLGLHFGHLLGGAVIIESIFGIPGIGKYAMDGIGNRDYPVIQGFVLYTGALFIVVNYLIDMLYLIINPQLQLQGRPR